MAHDPRFKDQLRKRAARLYDEGFTVRQIASELGVSSARAYILALEGGANMRPRGRKQKTA